MKKFFIYWWERFTGIARLRAELKSADGNIGVLYRENAKLKVLLNTACLRTAPTTMHELVGGLNAAKTAGNVCYINPKALKRVWPYGEVADGTVVCTDLMPECGVIYAPMHPAFFIAGRPA